MSMRDDRTQYPNFENRVFHIVPDGSNALRQSLRAKYGRNVYMWGAGSGVGSAIALANPGDTILFWPGTYTTTATINVNRPNICIRSATGNRNSVIFDMSATADTIVFTVTAAGDYTQIRDVTIKGDDSATPVDAVQVSGAGCVIDNCVLLPTTAVDANTNPGISLENDADDCAITNNFIKDHQVAIQLNAAERTTIKGNTVVSTDDAGIGVDAVGACNFSVVDGNLFYLRGGTGDIGVKVNNAALDLTVANNIFHEDISDPISPGTQAGNADTVMYNNSITGAGTTVDGTSAAIANLVAVVYT